MRNYRYPSSGALFFQRLDCVLRRARALFFQ
jgi:hypothetical protein